MDEDYDFVRVPSKGMDVLMETVSIDGSYSITLKKEVENAMDNIEYFSSVWVVLAKDGEKQAPIKAFVRKKHAQAYRESLNHSQDYIIVSVPIF